MCQCSWNDSTPLKTKVLVHKFIFFFWEVSLTSDSLLCQLKCATTVCSVLWRCSSLNRQYLRSKQLCSQKFQAVPLSVNKLFLTIRRFWVVLVSIARRISRNLPTPCVRLLQWWRQERQKKYYQLLNNTEHSAHTCLILCVLVFFDYLSSFARFRVQNNPNFSVYLLSETSWFSSVSLASPRKQTETVR